MRGMSLRDLATKILGVSYFSACLALSFLLQVAQRVQDLLYHFLGFLLYKTVAHGKNHQDICLLIRNRGKGQLQLPEFVCIPSQVA